MQDGIEKKRLHILKILQEESKPVGSQKITESLFRIGIDMSERTVRFHLLDMDRAGYTEYIGKRGRRITDEGRRELDRARVHERVGFLAARIDQMTYRMKFDLARREGTVLVNTSIIKREEMVKAYPLMFKVFEAGYAMGRMMTLFGAGEHIGDSMVPQDCIGIGTICSITVNGVLLSYGIPTFSRFGGILELLGGVPTRFTAIINYDGTSLDPLEIFIKSGMTDYLGATASGNGQIGASFRELPAASRDSVLSIAEDLEKAGLGAIMEVGWPGQPLLGIPVDESRFGAIIIGGLNPVAILEESGIEVQSRALSGLVDFRKLFSYSEIKDRIKTLT